MGPSQRLHAAPPSRRQPYQLTPECQIDGEVGPDGDGHDVHGAAPGKARISPSVPAGHLSPRAANRGGGRPVPVLAAEGTVSRPWRSDARRQEGRSGARRVGWTGCREGDGPVAGPRSRRLGRGGALHAEQRAAEQRPEITLRQGLFFLAKGADMTVARPPQRRMGRGWFLLVAASRNSKASWLIW